jgi:hypothetical protein
MVSRLMNAYVLLTILFLGLDGFNDEEMANVAKYEHKIVDAVSGTRNIFSLN